MRTKIFTERDRRLLERWLQDGAEDDETRKLFTQIRRRTPQVLIDLMLMRTVILELKRRGRWRGRVTGSSEFGSTLRRAESALTRPRRGGATSGASRR
jgi:hypothetical protein